MRNETKCPNKRSQMDEVEEKEEFDDSTANVVYIFFCSQDTP